MGMMNPMMNPMMMVCDVLYLINAILTSGRNGWDGYDESNDGWFRLAIAKV